MKTPGLWNEESTAAASAQQSGSCILVTLAHTDVFNETPRERDKKQHRTHGEQSGLILTSPFPTGQIMKIE